MAIILVFIKITGQFFDKDYKEFLHLKGTQQTDQKTGKS